MLLIAAVLCRGPDGIRVGRVRAERRRSRLLSRETHVVGASGGRRRARCLAGLLTVLVWGSIASLMWAGPASAAPPVFVPVAGSPFGDGGNPSAVGFSPSGGLLATVLRRRLGVGLLGREGRGAESGDWLAV